MKFFLDENFPKAAHALLANLGHQVFDLRGSAKEGNSDPEIFLEAQILQAVFLTTDRDFFHTIPHLHRHHAGVIVIALKQPNRRNILERLAWIISHLPLSSFSNRAIQLRDHTWLAVPPL
jgi:predicted nuclease of predicted toxin-antitoxin system